MINKRTLNRLSSQNLVFSELGFGTAPLGNLYKSISDEEKLAKYAALAGPAIKGAGGKFLARGIPVMTKESGEKTRTVVLEWESLEHAENGYNSEGYQEALKALDGAAIREFRYVEAAE